LAASAVLPALMLDQVHTVGEHNLPWAAVLSCRVDFDADVDGGTAAHHSLAAPHRQVAAGKLVALWAAMTGQAKHGEAVGAPPHHDRHTRCHCAAAPGVAAVHKCRDYLLCPVCLERAEGDARLAIDDVEAATDSDAGIVALAQAAQVERHGAADLDSPYRGQALDGLDFALVPLVRIDNYPNYPDNCQCLVWKLHPHQWSVVYTAGHLAGPPVAAHVGLFFPPSPWPEEV